MKTGKSMKNLLLKAVAIACLFLAMPMTHYGQSFQSNQSSVIEFDITKISLFEERIFFIYNLLNDDRFDVINSEEDGVFLISASEMTSTAMLHEAFQDFQEMQSKDFAKMDKDQAAETALQFKGLLPEEVINSLMMDIYAKSRQNNLCANADPFCTDNGLYQFPAGVNTGSGEPGPNYACLSSTPNPAWYYMRIGTPGNINIYMYSTPSEDIDFCCWGPYADPVSPCPNGLTIDKKVSCSYSPNATETCVIPSSAQTGDYFILVITNYSNHACNISFSKTGGSGTTDCGILPPLVSNDGPYCAGETIRLTGNAQAGATYNWSGPGGWTAVGQTVTRPNCTMAMAGTYTCTIHVGNQTSSANTPVQVFARPNANFTAQPSCLGSPTQFTNTSTSNPANQAMTYQWNFGDGQTSTQQSPSHQYSTVGNYNVTLTASCGQGACTSTKTLSVSVYPIPTANFSANSVCLGNSTQFTNTSTSNPGNQPMTYLWDFGDGQTSTQQNPTHQFSTAGVHTVTLTASCGQGACSNTKTLNVEVYSNPVANAGPDQTIQYGGTAQLNGSGGTGLFNYHWEPADKVVNPNAQNTQTIGLTESIVFTLTVTHPTGGCTSSDQMSVLIEGSNMTATASASPNAICLGETSQLTATTVGGTGNYNYSWSPSIGLDNPLAANPVATPTETTTYTCTVSDGYTTLTINTTVTVNNPEYEEVDEFICPDEVFSFYGQDYHDEGSYDYVTTTSQGCEKIITLHLHHYATYDNAHTTTEYICSGESYPFHSHTYNTTGVYPETLETVHGCDSVVWLNLTVYPPNDTTLVDPAICTSQTYYFHGMPFSHDGDIAYFDTIDHHGCLKVEKLVLSVGEYQMPPVEYVYECYSHDDTPSFYWDKSNQTYTQDTYDEIILPDPQGGCDFKYRLNLKFHQEFYHTESVTECDSYDWPIIPGSHYTSTNHHIENTVHTGGGPNFNCDSTYVLDLTIYHSNENTVPVLNQCDQYVWQFGWDGETYPLEEAGVYTKTIPTAHGCDSTVTINLQLDYSPTFPKVEGHAWVVGGSEFQYTIENYAIQTHPKSSHNTQWGLYNQDGTPFSKWDLVPYDNGDKCMLYIYTFERDSIELRAHTQSIGECACGDYTKSLWIHCSYHDVDENSTLCRADIFPNPNNGSMTLSFENMYGDIQVKVTDMTGTLVDSFHVYNSFEKQTHQYKPGKLSEGLYFFSISSKEGTITKKVVIIN